MLLKIIYFFQKPDKILGFTRVCFPKHRYSFIWPYFKLLWYVNIFYMGQYVRFGNSHILPLNIHADVSSWARSKLLCETLCP